MFFFIIEFLHGILGVKVPAVFSYVSTRMILSSVTSLVICIFIGPYFIRKLYEWKIGQPIRKEDCPVLADLHEKKKDTPTMGGILILVSMLVSMFLWMDWTHTFTLIMLVTTLVLGGVGAVDDFLKLKYRNSKGLKGRWKLCVQVIFSILLAVYILCPEFQEWVQQGIWFQIPKSKQPISLGGGQFIYHPMSLDQYSSLLFVPFIKGPVIKFAGISLILLACFFVVVITGSSNAVNLTDGLDGLAAGSVVMVAAGLALFAFISNNIEFAKFLQILYIGGSGEIAIYLMALIGACLGFLWYNGHPAQVFMGDIGSLSLGGIMGVSAILLRREFLLALMGGIFVAEALSVILQVLSYRYRNKKRIFLCSPLHHHFEYKGWAETKVVLRFWIIGLLLVLIGVASLKFQ